MTELAPIALLCNGNHNYRLLLPTVPCVSAHVDVIRCRLLDDIDPPPEICGFVVPCSHTGCPLDFGILIYGAYGLCSLLLTLVCSIVRFLFKGCYGERGR